MNIGRSICTKRLVGKLHRGYILSAIRNQTTQASATPEEGTTHFGFQTVKENEKQQKGTFLPVIR